MNNWIIRLFMTHRGSFSWIFFFFRFRGVSVLSTRSQIFPLNMFQRWPDWEGTKGFGEDSTVAVPRSWCDGSPSLSTKTTSPLHGEASLHDSNPSGYKLDWNQWRQSACWCMNSIDRQSPNMLNRHCLKTRNEIFVALMLWDLSDLFEVMEYNGSLPEILLLFLSLHLFFF